MKYGELVNFDPIESVVQLRSAGVSDAALQLVRTYVISDDMAERITEIIVPQLRFDHSIDNKGILIVGNYGTGKSHLMSVLSSLAEDSALLTEVEHQEARESLAAIAGKFKVVRAEIGATTMSLRDIVVAELEEHLENIGVDFVFPETGEVTGHKDAFEDLMSRFDEVFPGQGLLLVVDELLDFLRTRNDQELVLDLTFLREIGEVCQDLRFRFVSGVQEAIFDSPRFSFVADSVRRVQARFEQVIIATNDVKFVVSERLLHKSVEQKDRIREHLKGFAKYYDRFSERLEEFTDLFPVHPDYINTFERISIVEKREVLKTLSSSIGRILDEDVPEGTPGLIAFDSYWRMISQNASFRAIPEVREVINCSQILESRVENAPIEQQYQDTATRLIHALSVHRLTTGDVYVPIGASAAELRDRLCIFDPVIEGLDDSEPDKDLETYVETVLLKIAKAVSGQFISRNSDNGQHYLDLKKTEDFDAQVQKRAETLSPDQLDRHYYEALRRVMECEDMTYVSGYKIWQHEVIWHEHKVGRGGYLFFGTPNERSTAVPRRDFYIYFVPPHVQSKFGTGVAGDEILFSLSHPDEEFKDNLRGYAASQDLVSTATGHAKAVYQSKASEYLRALVSWIQENMMTVFEVCYQGHSKSMAEWAKGKLVRQMSDYSPTSAINFRDWVNSVAAACLAPYFAEQASEYPKFRILITESNREQAAQETLRAIAEGDLTKQASAVLDALELLDGESISASSSKYAGYVLGKLDEKTEQQVLGRSEIIVNHNGLEYMDPSQRRLEPEWVVVVLAALVYSGNIVLSIGAEKLDATRLKEMAVMNMSELVAFKHVEKPKDWNRPAIRALLECLELPPGLVELIMQGREEPVQQMQSAIERQMRRIAEIEASLHSGFNFWQVDLLASDSMKNEVFSISQARIFFESLTAYTTPGKLKNFNHTLEEIHGHTRALKNLSTLEALRKFVMESGPSVAWLEMTETVLPAGHEWKEMLGNERSTLIDKVTNSLSDEFEPAAAEVATRLRHLKEMYFSIYSKWHDAVRLSFEEGEERDRLLHDTRLLSLEKLAEAEIIGKGSVAKLRAGFEGLVVCARLIVSELSSSPMCPHCRFRPTSEADNVTATNLTQELETELDRVFKLSVSTLLRSLEDPTVRKNIASLNEENRRRVEAFAKTGTLPNPLDDRFVSVLQELFAGWSKVAIRFEELEQALLDAGGPATVEELKERFNKYIERAVGSGDRTSVRVVFER